MHCRVAMFIRCHTLIALLSVALHLADIFVAAGHQHVHALDECCTSVCSERAAEHTHSDGHEHGCGHTHSHCHAKVATTKTSLPASHGDHPASKPHHDCAICQHLAMTPAFVVTPTIFAASTGSEPVLCEVASLLPPLRTVECRSRAPPFSLA
jgi:hypothetical protein